MHEEKAQSGAREEEGGVDAPPPGNRRRTAPGYRRKEGFWEVVPTAEMVRTTRICAGLTQEEAGNLVHVSRKGWQKWELGERNMSPGLWDLFLAKVSGKLRERGYE